MQAPCDLQGSSVANTNMCKWPFSLPAPFTNRETLTISCSDRTVLFCLRTAGYRAAGLRKEDFTITYQQGGNTFSEGSRDESSSHAVQQESPCSPRHLGEVELQSLGKYFHGNTSAQKTGIYFIQERCSNPAPVQRAMLIKQGIRKGTKLFQLHNH